MGRHSKFEEKIPYTHPVYGGWGVPIPWYEMSGPEAAHLYRAAALVFESLPPTSVLVRGIQAIEAWRAENWPRCSGPAVFRGLREIEVEGDVLHLVTDGGRKVSVRFGESGAEWCRVDFRRPGPIPVGKTSFCRVGAGAPSGRG
ncbi:MAG: hypothetical protein UY25_C0002G0034 [Candidatus Yanofskybacteria bacterium GW2011_GWC1_48_11]|uniref:Uncharacterized protein n=1 Tax=Candidatus Yanofskybacteria bacterium GW2011_GWC1_48_11 TaxID=1619027 RepID=A0A837ILE4_9BACT|nr:MAG: hypothetical protein UY25_C0002G0034 [Candidatus Yanofskybacteria bacterium GW2011_GWC1_48_11]